MASHLALPALKVRFFGTRKWPITQTLTFKILKIG